MSRKIERGRLRAAAAVFCAVALFVGAALAAQAAVTLSSKDSVDKQAEQLHGYIEKLPEKERRAWYRQLEEMVTEEKKSSEKAAETFQNNTVEDTVWVSKSGKRYHASPNCSGMKKAVEIPREDAVRRGLTPCKKCKP